MVADVDEAAARALVDLLRAEKGEASAVAFDQGSIASIEAVATALEADGGVDVLCVNAAVGAPTTELAAVDPEAWDRIQHVNLRGAFLTVQRFVPLLGRSDAPAIVFTASTAAIKAHPGRLPYAASKGGLLALSRSLAVELGSLRIRVNTVCPGGTMTPLAASVGGPDFAAALDELRSRIPLARIAEPEDVAAAMVFLASEDARHITGVDLVVDGGQSVRP